MAIAEMRALPAVRATSRLRFAEAEQTAAIPNAVLSG